MDRSSKWRPETPAQSPAKSSGGSAVRVVHSADAVHGDADAIVSGTCNGDRDLGVSAARGLHTNTRHKRGQLIGISPIQWKVCHLSTVDNAVNLAVDEIHLRSVRNDAQRLG